MKIKWMTLVSLSTALVNNGEFISDCTERTKYFSSLT